MSHTRQMINGAHLSIEGTGSGAELISCEPRFSSCVERLPYLTLQYEYKRNELGKVPSSPSITVHYFIRPFSLHPHILSLVHRGKPSLSIMRIPNDTVK